MEFVIEYGISMLLCVCAFVRHRSIGIEGKKKYTHIESVKIK